MKTFEEKIESLEKANLSFLEENKVLAEKIVSLENSLKDATRPIIGFLK